MKRLIPVVALLLANILAGPIAAQESIDYADTQLEDPGKEADAKALMETIRCIVCQGQSIADSNADLAGDMRRLIRERVAAGERPEAVREWLIERYGEWVSFEPQPSLDTAPLWFVPALALIAGVLLVRSRLRRKGS